MRVLLSNDDGIGSEGLAALAEALEDLGEVWVVAPDSERSAQSHSLSLHRPLRVDPLRPRWYAVDGTPADCIYLGLHGLLDKPPDIVVSGVNKGSNLGTDIFYSGTVAAAREAVLAGIPAIAVSLHLEPDDVDRHWATATGVVRRLIPQVLSKGLPPRTLLNVNTPNVPPEALRGVRSASMGVRIYDNRVAHRDDPWGRPYYWIGGAHARFGAIEGSDGPLMERGWATVTPVHSDLTHRDFLETLREWTDD
jgi:5'-nucleotidase